jgi:hypothetical protein
VRGTARTGSHRVSRIGATDAGAGSDKEIVMGEYFTWWQGILVVILIALIVFYWQYKKKQY